MLNQLRNIRLVDTTLRDGEQAPGVAFSTETKIKILQDLYDAGLRDFEIGTPAIGFQEQDAIEKMLKLNLPSANCSVWCRAQIDDLKIAYSLGSETVNLSLPVSEIQMQAIGKNKEWVVSQLKKCLAYASKHFKFITVGAQDASRANVDFLYEYINIAQSFEKVKRIRIADTVGILNPFTTQTLIGNVVYRFPTLEFEFHGHNDLGMANANALAAIYAGADLISGTINGLGERCGNTPIEEIIIALEYSEGIKLKIDKIKLQTICQFVSEKSNRTIHDAKPFNGTMCFTHESGIHTRSLIVDEKAYQPFSPSDLGLKKTFVFGKHSGSVAVKAVLVSNGIHIDEFSLKRLMHEIKSSNHQNENAITEEDVLNIFKERIEMSKSTQLKPIFSCKPKCINS